MRLGLRPHNDAQCAMVMCALGKHASASPCQTFIGPPRPRRLGGRWLVRHTGSPVMGSNRTDSAMPLCKEVMSGAMSSHEEAMSEAVMCITS